MTNQAAINHLIEEFPIIGFYLYHVTSAGQYSNWTTSGLKQHIRNSYTMGCPPVRGDNPRALASGLSYVQV